MYVTSLFVSALLMAHLTSSYPTGSGPTGTGLAPAVELQNLLDRLESLTEQRPVKGPITQREEVYAPASPTAEEAYEERAADSDLLQDHLDVALIRELLSAQNLRTVRNNSPRSSSGCFGRRMDRIGSMSSLGCNTVGNNSPKSA
uniref:B-type natriuretic peptide n=1 Tax=Periophthalmus modestus TaxID=146921 RepID=A0A2Z5WP66_9GOBI|nr:B-type natriuretic peptide [Periophthalmus modestus]